LFIVNPIAGKGKSKKIVPLIEETMKKNNVNYQIVETSAPGSAKEIAGEALNKGFNTVVAVGGDGTIYEVVNGIVGRPVNMGIIPGGTGNDLAKTLSIPRDAKGALDVIVKNKVSKIDVGKINGKHFINVAGLGFDCEVLRETQRFKKHLSGMAAYLAGLFKALLFYKGNHVEIVLDGKKISKDIFLIAVANGKYYGGGMMVAPLAMIQDGYFDICLIKNVSKLTVLKLLASFVKGKHLKYEPVESYRAKRIEIISPQGLPINADGEIIGASPIIMECIEGAVSVITP